MRLQQQAARGGASACRVHVRPLVTAPLVPHVRRCGAQRLPVPRVFDKLRDLFAQQAGTAGKEHAPNMVPIDPDSEGGLGGTSEAAFGPLALLLVGYDAVEVEAVRTMLLDMDADIVKLIPCTNAMLDGTLEEALNADYPCFEQLPIGTQRAVVLSGMVANEVSEILSAYYDAGLPPTVFAAAVPNNYSHIVRELVDEIHADHGFMMSQQAS